MSNLNTKDLPMLLLGFLSRTKHPVITCGSRHGLTSVQTITLLHLGAHKPKPMNCLAAHMGCDASNATGIIDGLQRKGLTARRESIEDRRVKVIELTTEGKELRSIILEELGEDLYEQIICKLTEDEQNQLLAILGKIYTLPNIVNTCEK